MHFHFLCIEVAPGGVWFPPWTDVSWDPARAISLHSITLRYITPPYIRSRLLAAGARAAIANQIQLSLEERLRRPDGHILRIISAKFCSPVRKLLMERVNGQDVDGAR